MRRILTLGSRATPAARTVRLLALVALGAAACGGDTVANPAADDRPARAVVVSTPILGDVVADALVDLPPGTVDVEVIMPIGADPHDFEATARQAEAMEDADLVIVNGLGLEEGLGSIVDAVAASGTTVFAFGDHVDVRALDDAPDDDEHQDEHAIDPHVWLDPRRVADAVGALGPVLVDIGLDRSAVDASIAGYVERLGQLDRDVADLLDAVPASRRVLVTNHDAFGYFADRYGFEVLGTVIPSLTTSAAASAAQLEALAAAVVERDVPAIFAETTESDRLAQALADEVGGDVAVVELHSGSLGGPGSGAETYVDLMTTNAALIAAALT